MKILSSVAILTLLSVVLYDYHLSQQLDYKTKFESFTIKYQKSYSQAEKLYRQFVYEQNLKMIEAHNSDTSQTYKMGENKFADLTQEEFASIYLTGKPMPKQMDDEYIPTNIAAPQVDWSTLTRVRDYSNCPAGHAFTAVGATESYFRVKVSSTTPDLSVQQLIDCDVNSVNKGCQEGWPEMAMSWVVKNGLQSEGTYPFAKVVQTCKYQSGPYKPNGRQNIQAANVKSAVTNYPVSVWADANKWAFYSSGVFSDCGKSQNTSGLIVGYYSDGTWIFKNNWGTNWGENGFIRLASGNTCGILDYPYIIN